METVINHPVYQQQNYREDDIQELMQELVMSEDSNNRYDDAERECICKLIAFYQVKKFRKAK